jgi:hypothetical protein
MPVAGEYARPLNADQHQLHAIPRRCALHPIHWNGHLPVWMTIATPLSTKINNNNKNNTGGNYGLQFFRNFRNFTQFFSRPTAIFKRVNI